MRAIALVAACLTLQDVRNAECRVYCMRSGYDSGSYRGDKCVCEDLVQYDRATEKRLTFGARKPPKDKPIVVPYDY